MAVSPNTGSTLTYPNGTNKTSTALSTNIIIMVGTRAVGAVQTLSIDEARSIKMIDEVGTDGHIDSAPNSSTNISGSCKRVRFDRLRVTEAFSRGFLHAASQAYPFDIVILDKQKRNVASQISTVIKNVWIKSLNVEYSATDFVIMDTMGWDAESIYSILNNGGGITAAQGGEIGVKYATIPGPAGVTVPGGGGLEQLVDTGGAGYRGSLTASGLIDIGSNGVNIF